jgi:hypothetical protein
MATVMDPDQHRQALGIRWRPCVEVRQSSAKFTVDAASFCGSGVRALSGPKTVVARVPDRLAGCGGIQRRSRTGGGGAGKPFQLETRSAVAPGQSATGEGDLLRKGGRGEVSRWATCSLVLGVPAASIRSPRPLPSETPARRSLRCMERVQAASGRRCRRGVGWAETPPRRRTRAGNRDRQASCRRYRGRSDRSDRYPRSSDIYKFFERDVGRPSPWP